MDKPLTLIIFKHSVNPKFPPAIAKMYEGSYDCGWLSDNLDEPFIIQWGNSKDQNNAKKLMDDVLDKQGERPVLFYNKEIPKKDNGRSVIQLTNEQYTDIITNAERWH